MTDRIKHIKELAYIGDVATLSAMLDEEPSREWQALLSAALSQAIQVDVLNTLRAKSINGRLYAVTVH